MSSTKSKFLEYTVLAITTAAIVAYFTTDVIILDD